MCTYYFHSLKDLLSIYYVASTDGDVVVVNSVSALMKLAFQ